MAAMTDPLLTQQDKIAKIKASFALQLPARLKEARLCFEAMQIYPVDGEALARLHLILHSINGTGNTLGFSEIGAIAADGELLTKQLTEDLSAHARLIPLIAQTLDNVQNALDNLSNNAPSSNHNKQLARYEMPVARKGIDGRTQKLIFICDDDPLLLSLISEQLLCFGYHTVLFNNTQELRKAVLKEKPAVIIMDIVFPANVSEGTDVLRDLRALGNLFPVIFISVRTDFQARLNAIRAGGEAYFHKPVKAMELVALLDNLIGQSQPEPFRILVVDDEPEMANYVSLILEEAGMTTMIALLPEMVLDAVNDFAPDLVLMDMYMPNCSGREVSKLIRQIPDFVSIPIVYLSSETDKMKQFSAMSIGADGFLTKPIDPQELVLAVSLRAERMRTLRSLMTRDSLTSLFNHTTTTQLLDNAIQVARQKNASISFAMLDLDHFKAVNDTYGHPIGDHVLQGLARVLRQRLRQSDLIGRYGGEEFAVVLHEVTPAKAHQIMEQLRDYFSRVVFNAGEIKFSCSFSCGIASFPEIDSLESIREAADAALYEAKFHGRNRVVSYIKKPA
jgi:diguanylate cyclase (GGDEF)-like protein